MIMRKGVVLLVLSLCAFGIATAIVPFREHRYDVFKSMPVNHESIVFLGNSITNMHPWTEAFGSDPRVVNRGTGGAGSSEILANIRTICVGEPAKIFLMIGINDLFKDNNAKAVVENVRLTLEKIREISPRTQIYVQSLLPTIYNNYVEECNALTADMVTRFNEAHATEANPATFIDLYTPLLPYLSQTSPSGSGYFVDGLHLSAATYKLWLDVIAPYVGIAPVYPDEIADLQYDGGFGKTDSHGARATSMSTLPITLDDVLFFGDEMVSSGEWHELLGNPQVKNRGTGWQYEGTDILGIRRTSKYIDATFYSIAGVEKQSPKQVLVYTGTAEINGEYALSTVLQNYKQMVEKIRGYVSENTKISILSLMPSTMTTAERVQEFNAGLAEYANSELNVEYIDIYTPLHDLSQAIEEGLDTGTPVFTGNMLMGRGYVMIANILAEHIEGCHPITPDDDAMYRQNIAGRLSTGWYQIQVDSGVGIKGYHEASRGKYLCGQPHGYLRQKWGVGLTDNAQDPTTLVYITAEDDGYYNMLFHSSPENEYTVSSRGAWASQPGKLMIIPDETVTKWKILGDGNSPWVCYNHNQPAVMGVPAIDESSECYYRFTKLTNDMISPMDGKLDDKYLGQFVKPRYAQDPVPAVSMYYINMEGQAISYVSGEPVSLGISHDMVIATALPVSFPAELNGFVTVCSPLAHKIPEGVEGYVTGVVEAKDRLRIERIADGIIPAHTGVILKGQAGATCYLPMSEEEGSAVSTLQSAEENTPAPANYFELSVVGGCAGFFSQVIDSLKAFRAYYVPESTTSGRGYRLVSPNVPPIHYRTSALRKN